MEARGFKVMVRIVVEADEEGRFYAYCPELKGVHVEGGTEDEAVSFAREAASAYVTSLIRHDDPIPIGAIDRIVEPAALEAPRRETRVEELCIAA